MGIGSFTTKNGIYFIISTRECPGYKPHDKSFSKVQIPFVWRLGILTGVFDVVGYFLFLGVIIFGRIVDFAGITADVCKAFIERVVTGEIHSHFEICVLNSRHKIDGINIVKIQPESLWPIRCVHPRGRICSVRDHQRPAPGPGVPLPEIF